MWNIKVLYKSREKTSIFKAWKYRITKGKIVRDEITFGGKRRQYWRCEPMASYMSGKQAIYH